MMNKVLSLLLCLLFIACNDEKQNSFVIEGVIKNSNAKTIYLEENPPEGQPMIVDSAKLEQGGKFSLEATTAKEEGMFSLRTDDGFYPIAMLISDSRKITIEADPSNDQTPYTVKGSDATQSMLDFDRAVDERLRTHLILMRQIDSLSKVSARPDEKRLVDSITAIRFSEYESNAESLKNFAREFLDKSNSPVLTLYAYGSFQTKASQYGLRGFTQLETADIINKAAGKFPNHTVLNDQKKKLRSNIAPDFTLPDTNGNPLALSSFKGKYVLVDFWASWCKPCRDENPNVVAAFNQFRDKNFTILGVSLDKTKDAWVKAIQDDGLAWSHVSDLKYWESAAAQLYGVQSIPYNVLVDPNGTIVAENLRGRELHTALERLLK